MINFISFISIHDTNFLMDEILSYRFSEDNKKLDVFIEATPELKLLKIKKDLDVNQILTIKFVQHENIILQISSLEFKFSLDFNGEVFSEKIEILSDEPIF
jgi:hypothetical protein